MTIHIVESKSLITSQNHKSNSNKHSNLNLNLNVNDQPKPRKIINTREKENNKSSLLSMRELKP